MTNMHSYYYEDSSTEPSSSDQSGTRLIHTRKTNEKKVVEFIIGNQGFAVDLFDTKEVINSPEITPIPNTSAYIMGMTNLRGVITTVIDLNAFLSIRGTEAQKIKERVIILDPSLCHKAIGIVVDDVRSVQNYRGEDIDLTDGSSERYQLGVIKKQVKTAEGKRKSELVILLDIRGIVQKIQDEL